MATRSLTTPDLLEQKSRPARRTRMRAYRCDTHALEETQTTDSNGQAAFTTLTTEVDHVFWANWSGITDGRKYQWFPIRFMEIEDGGTGASTAPDALDNLGVHGAAIVWALVF
jgi:phage-related protein